MNLSQKLIEAALAPNTGEVALFLLTFSHKTFDQPIHLVNNIEDIVSRGQTYTAFPLELILPPDNGDTLPAVQITCLNASLDLIDAIRKVPGPMSVKLELILASSPDYIEASIENMRVATVTYDQQKIVMTCTVDDLLNTAFPAEKYLPSNFPGLFRE